MEKGLSNASDKEKLIAFLNEFQTKIMLYVSFQDALMQTIDILYQDYESNKPNVFKIFELYSKGDIVSI